MGCFQVSDEQGIASLGKNPLLLLHQFSVEMNGTNKGSVIDTVILLIIGNSGSGSAVGNTSQSIFMFNSLLTTSKVSIQKGIFSIWLAFFSRGSSSRTSDTPRLDPVVSPHPALQLALKVHCSQLWVLGLAEQHRVTHLCPQVL